MIFLDSDDWMDDDAVSQLLEAQLMYPDRFVVCNWYLVYFNSKDNNAFLLRKNSAAQTRIMNVKETIDAFTMKTLPQSAWARIFSAKIIHKYNLTFKNGMQYGEDQLFSLEYLWKTQGSIYLEKPLFNILRRKGSITHTPHKKRKSIVSREGWVPYMISSDEIMPDVRTACYVYAARIYQSCITEAIFEAEDSYEIRVLQKKAKQFAKYFLASKAVSNARKIFFVCMVYLPVPMAKLAVYILKYKNNHTVMTDTIPYW